MNLQVGQIVEATRKTDVCSVGERGVVYEIYYLGGMPGASIIFETGRYDGFSPEEQDLMLKPITTYSFIAGYRSLFDSAARTYHFVNVMQLGQDYQRGRFNFHPEDR